MSTCPIQMISLSVSQILGRRLHLGTYIIMHTFLLYLALEWQGTKDVFQPVHIALCPTKCLLILRTDKGQHLKVVNMDRFTEVPAWLSNNKHQNVLLLHFPKDCDLVRVVIKKHVVNLYEE